jgi:hypothetical protein
MRRLLGVAASYSILIVGLSWNAPASAGSLDCGYEDTIGHEACVYGEDYEWWSRSILTRPHNHRFSYLDGSVLVTSIGEKVRLFYPAPQSFTPTNISVGHSRGAAPCRGFTLSTTPKTIQGSQYYRVSMGAKRLSQCWVDSVFFSIANPEPVLYRDGNLIVTAEVNEQYSDMTVHFENIAGRSINVSCHWTISYNDGTTRQQSYVETMMAGLTAGLMFDSVTIPTDMACSTS